MSLLLRLKLAFFFSPKVIIPVIAFGVLGFLVVDDAVQRIADGVRFSGAMQPLEGLFQGIVVERGSRAVWLWTLLPASIAWVIVGRQARRIVNFF